MPNPIFHKIKKIGVNRNLTKIKSAWIYKDNQFMRVWSGASEVSYYDGDVLLGKEEIDDGEDVLHPSIDTTKSGYTLYGWATKKNPTPNDRVTQYLADGDPKTLYAIYVPNTLVVLSATVWVDAAGNPNYRLDSKVDGYLNGSSVLQPSRWYATGPFESNASFTFNLGIYQNANATLWSATRDYGETYFNGNQIARGTDVRDYYSCSLSNRSYSMRCYGWCNHADSWAICLMGITKITLSNPEAWQ